MSGLRHIIFLNTSTTNEIIIICLTCLVEGEILIEHIIPNYHLEIARKDGYEEWKKGYLGLVHCNAPDYVWEYKPLLDPVFVEPNDDNLPSNHPKVEAMITFGEYIEKIEDCFISDSMQGHRFVEACKVAGYNPEEDGYHVVHWFIALVNKKIFEMGITI